MCNYCFNLGHWKNKLAVLAAKWKSGKNKSQVNYVNPVLVTDVTETTKDFDHGTSIEVGEEACDPKLVAMKNFVPFITEGCVSLLNSESKIPVKILRDTGSSESFILESVLPFSEVSSEGRSVLIRGIGLNTLSVPLHRVHLTCDLVCGEVSLGVRPSLPVDGITVILGNNLAGGRVWREVIPPPEVVPIPVTGNSDILHQTFPEVFTTCVVTRAKSREMTFEKQEVSKYVVPGLITISPISHRDLVDAQQKDPELQKLFDAVISPQEVRSAVSGCFIQDEMLLRKYVPYKKDLLEECIIQVVVPKQFRDVVLQHAHGEVAGHLGVKKTYERILRQFYWPRLKKDISSFIRTCHTCQVTGKPNQLLRPVPLSPIAVTNKPVEHLIIHCVVAQEKMKNHYDKHAEVRVFTPGDQVLILLPSSRSPFCAKFTGPYIILRKLSNENYQVATPDRRKSRQCFHVNLLKAYHSRNSGVQPTNSIAPVVTASFESHQPFVEGEDMIKEDIVVPEYCVLLPRLKNSETLQNLDAMFSHLTEVQSKDLTQLLWEFPGLFSDIPTRTHLIQHDVDVGDAQPIRQRFYRAPVSKREALESEIQYMLENGIAVPSCSSWASPCLLVRKMLNYY